MEDLALMTDNHGENLTRVDNIVNDKLDISSKVCPNNNRRQKEM